MCHHYGLDNRYGIICVINDYGYVVFVVITISFLHHSWHTTGYKSNTTGITSGTPELTRGMLWGLCCSVFSFWCSVLLTINVCHFVFFLLADKLSVVRFIASLVSSIILKFFFQNLNKNKDCEYHFWLDLCQFNYICIQKSLVLITCNTS